nr:RHS repeat-associated core domain-containing protein [Pseudidiomarina donghaiensis]
MQASSTATLLTIASGTPFTQRGFTDHEHIDEAQLIHMNGRVYDYNLGRFLSVDPFIQAPGNSQSLNPYSYIMNNPLAGTDPSGYIAKCMLSIHCDTDESINGVRIISRPQDYAQLSSNGNEQQAPVTNNQKEASEIGSQNGSTNQSQLSFEQTREALELGGLELTAEHKDGSLSYSAGNDTYLTISPDGSYHKIVNSEPSLESVSPESYIIGGIGIKASAKGLIAFRAALQVIRTNYIKGLSKIGAEATELLASGKSAEYVVRYLSGKRNQLKLDMREQGPWVAKQWANARNYFKYGNKAGPSPEDLLD